jgi:hypothetical protein
VTALDTRVTALESVVPSTSNSLDGRITVATNAHTVVSNIVAIIATNYTSKTDGILGTNAYGRVGAIEAAYYTTNVIPYTNGNVYVTGTVTALSFVGNGSGITNLSATATNVVSQITVGASNMTGSITFTGTPVEVSNNGTVKVWQVAYLEKTFAPVATTYEYIWGMPRDEEVTLLKVWGKPDSYNCTIQIVSQGSNDAWRTCETNTVPLMCFAVGTWQTNFVSDVVGVGTGFGVRVTDVDTRTTNMTIGIKYKY